MKDLLKTVVDSLAEKGNINNQNRAKLQAVDYMDDGSRICLSIDIDGKEVRESALVYYHSLMMVMMFSLLEA